MVRYWNRILDVDSNILGEKYFSGTIASADIIGYLQ